MRGFGVPVCVALIATAGAAADVRTYDGSSNNAANPLWGQAGSLLIRGPYGAMYKDGLGQPMPRASGRVISNAVSAQTPAGLGNARQLSSMAWQWGQFIDHDFALVNEGSEYMPIEIPAGDPVFDPNGQGGVMMPFFRSECVEGVTTPRQHANVITHWLDGSGVYGSDETRALALREMASGRMLTSAGNMLPYNSMGLPNAGGLGGAGFVAGDIRSNEQTGLLAMHTLFVREHNRVAGILGAANPGWNDEQIYQHARKIVGGEIASITYNEWLPAMLGPAAPGSYAGYDPATDPRMNNSFTAAAFRFGHSMLNDMLLRFNEDGTEYAGGHLSLIDAFFTPQNMDTPEEMDAVVRGLARQEANEVDTQAVDAVRNLLFGPPGAGRDLLALNMQRGRDHGIPDYNTLRTDYGLAPVASFTDITSDTALAGALSDVFNGDVNTIDAWIGLMAEDHLPGGSMGETLATIIREQFDAMREGDRFFYLNDPDLSADEIAFIDSVRLSDLVLLNTDIQALQGDIFFVPAPGAAAALLLAGLGAAGRRRRL